MECSKHKLTSSGLDSEGLVSSYGESDLTIDSTQVGKVRVLSAYAGASLFPRLLLRVGVLLQRAPARYQGQASTEAFELRDLAGELRLNEAGDPVCEARLTGQRRPVRFPADGYEAQLELACDFDHQRLERLEARRDGEAPRLWLALWPTVHDGSTVLHAQIRPIQLAIPRDVWLEFLRGCGGADYELLEIRYPAASSEHIQRAATHLQEARARIAAGDFASAAAACRKVVEAALEESRSGTEAKDWGTLMSHLTDAKRGPEYSGIAARLKQLSSFAVHDFASDVKFTRADALFLVRTTHAFLVLVAHLKARLAESRAG